MLSPESLKALFTGAALLAVVVFAGLGKLPPEFSVMLAIAVAMPSGAPEIIARVRDAIMKSSTPPKLAALLVAGALAATTTGCALFESSGASAPATAQPCSGMTVDQCAAKYQAELLACTASSSTRSESEKCEDELRARYGRPSRVPRSMLATDAGVEAGLELPDDENALPVLEPMRPPYGLDVVRFRRGAS